MKKLLILLLIIFLMSACNQAVCPAYSDSANDMKNTLTQKGNYRADGINKVYRDTFHKKLR
jgi:type III secretory pathway lipoprotein EscJ